MSVPHAAGAGLMPAGPGDPRDLLAAVPFACRTLTGLLRERTPADGVYLEIEGRRLAWSELAELSSSAAGRLSSLGIGRGDVVCQMSANTLAHVVTIFAIARLGAVECPVNAALRGESLLHVIAHSGAAALVVDGENVDRVTDACGSLDRPPAIIVRGERSEPVSGRGVVVREEELETGRFAEVEVSPMDPATIMYTSGTTGPAKGVVLPHHFAFSAAAVKAGVWGLSFDDVLFTPLPLFHSNARYSTLLTAAVIGARAVVVDRFSASRFWDQVRSCGATEVGTVGTVAPILLERPPSPGDREHEVRMMHGAGALAPGMRATFEERFGVRLVTGFSMTETSHFSTTSPDDPNRHSASGRPVAGFRVAILDDADEVLPVSEIGEIAVRPEIPFALFSGYHRQPEATLAAFRNLWFHTGDLGFLDEQGLLHWVDRKKDAIRRKGEMISSHDVEAAATGFPGVAEAVAVGIPGDLGEEEVQLFVRSREGASVDLGALAQHCRETLPDFAAPRYYALVEELPQTSTMKIDKKRLRSEPSAFGVTWDSASSPSPEPAPSGKRAG